jgi:anhydro-N-acetylmuramic acid kinase
MIKKNYNVLAIMSGTSLDGVDLAYIYFTYTNKWQFDVIHAETVPYTDNWVNKLKDAVTLNNKMLYELNSEYTALLANVINDFIKRNAVTSLDFIASHGHTVLHQPENGITLQIGNIPQIARLVNKTVVCDFRIQDVEMGGQGAPLVPIGDRILFSECECCLNLGGFSNISFEEDGERIAFDICPVNTVLNYYAGRLGKNFDQGGNIAKSGRVINELLDELNNFDFYKMPYPKSLGFEFVKSVVFPVIDKYDLQVNDILCTFSEHIAGQIANVINDTGKKSVLITGGGAYNTFITELLQHKLKFATITIPDDNTIQFKEAIIFGLLGVLKIRDEINVLCSVTGAAKNHSSGKIYHP